MLKNPNFLFSKIPNWYISCTHPYYFYQNGVMMLMEPECDSKTSSFLESSSLYLLLRMPTMAARLYVLVQLKKETISISWNSIWKTMLVIWPALDLQRYCTFFTFYVTKVLLVFLLFVQIPSKFRHKRFLTIWHLIDLGTNLFWGQWRPLKTQDQKEGQKQQPWKCGCQ